MSGKYLIDSKKRFLRLIKFVAVVLRSILYVSWLVISVMPCALCVVFVSFLGVKGDRLYWFASFWLKMAVDAARVIAGVRYSIQGFENLPREVNSGVILLVKHQSAYETFLMPAIMPHPLAYVFKRELLYIPFFGWAMGRLDMIHIDRAQKARAFQRVVEQGKELLKRGVWVIMFPEGTRIPRGKVGKYKSGGVRLAIETGVDVIPVAVTSGRCWPRKSFLLYPGTVDVSIGQSISSKDITPDVLNMKVEQWIESEMRRLDPHAYH
jgi:1-acyl-sn-glycerol-3-phosphate acyltransferase